MGIQKRRDYCLMGDSENLRNFMEEAEFELSIEGWLGFEKRSTGYFGRMEEHEQKCGCTYDRVYWRMVRNPFLSGYQVS